MFGWIGWRSLPVHEAVAAWRAKRCWLIGALAVLVAVPLVGIWLARSYWVTENQEEHATAQVSGIIDENLVALTWRSGERVQEGIYDSSGEDTSYEIGDEIDIAYPAGHPEQLHGLQGGAILAAAMAMELAAIGNTAAMCWIRVRPLGRQIQLARGSRGVGAHVRLTAGRGNRALIWPHDDDRPLDHTTDEPAGAVRVGGRSQTAAIDVERAEVRGDVRPRGVVVVRVGDELLNTYGLVQRPVTSTDDD
jgi:hypothetical protein